MGKTIKPVTCPSCSGHPLVKPMSRSQVCLTCNGGGHVWPGTMCFWCGRSVQSLYRGIKICGSAACKAVVDEKLKLKTSDSLMINEDIDAYNKAWSMFE